MSQFSELLSTAVAASGLTQVEVEARTGIERSALSRLMSGALVPSRTNLERLFHHFQPGSMVGHELVFAHLRDEAAAAGLPAEQLHIRLSAELDLRDQLSASLAADIDLLAKESVLNSDFALLVADWAAVIRRHHAALDQKIYPFHSADQAPLVAEPKPSSSKRRTRPVASLPRGASQQPTA